MAILRDSSRKVTMEQFKIDIDNGLSSTPKTLPSKYFYDEIGDDLFVQIMQMPEYYLTRAEFEIFERKTAEIVAQLGLKKPSYFELIELGAGDGTKTKQLLTYLLSNEYTFDYLPVDISQNALDGLKSSLKSELPTLSVKPKQGDYFEVLQSLKTSDQPKVVLFLGSNIGNMLDDLAANFLQQLSAVLQNGDRLFLGVDLIKSREIVLPAYNDTQGITRAFNLNLLTRMNRELGADFVVENFDHLPEYTEEEGVARSFLRSKVTQSVRIEALNKTFQFSEGEKIHTEISRKYNDEVLTRILMSTDFSICGKLTDSNNYFADYILER